MNYYLRGKGSKTIIFLHGWGGSYSSFEGFIPYFENKMVVCNVEFDGFGNCLEPSGAFEVKDFALKVIEIIKKEKLENVCLVGHSFGGRIALWICGNYPSLCSKLVLVNSAGLLPRWNLSRQFKIFRFKLCKKLVAYKILKPSYLKRFGSADYALLSPIMKQTLVKVVNEDLSLCSKKISIPTLIFWGENDKETPLYMAKKLHKLISNSSLKIFKNSGHFSYLENSKCFTLALLSFLC